MNINLTLAVQAINFFIAYVFLSKMLLKPGLDVIRAEAYDRDLLRKKVIAEQENLAKMHDYKLEQWRSCQSYFQLQRPKIEAAYVEPKPYAIKIAQELNADQKSKLINEITQALKQKVVHG